MIEKQPNPLLQDISKTQVIDLFSPESSSISADSHEGLVRTTNEDSFAYYLDKKQHIAVLVVADGIGGNEGGEIASMMTAKTIIGDLRNAIQSRNFFQQDAVFYIKNALERINFHIYQENELLDRLNAPMGTTLSMLVLFPGKALTVHVGDSRIYRIRNQKIESLTKDHTFVQRLFSLGKIKSDEMKTHPFAHVIYKSVGTEPKIRPDIRFVDRVNGDCFILCSDGLTGHVSDKEILKVATENGNAKSVVQTLMRETLARGATDNVTILCYYQQ